MVWTKEQNDAVTARGGSLLVSAAAGSGKTAVLVERAISLICDEKNPVDADRLLVVTFSNAAAAEMRQRMSARLSAMIRDNPDDLFLQRQQSLLSTAHISTIHSFCLDLLRSNFQNLDISPDFSIADEHELAVMKSDCAAACIERFYQDDEDGGFLELAELIIAGKDDSRLAEIMLKIYDFGRSHPFFEDWLDEKLAMYDTQLPVGETVWGRSLLNYARDSLEFCRGSVLEALKLAAGDERLEKAYGDAFRSDLAQIESCLEAVNGGGWNSSVAALRGFVFERLCALRGDVPAKLRAQSLRAAVKDVINGLSGKYLNATEEDFKRDIDDLRPKIKLLFALVKEFDREFSAAKAEKRRLDFSDFEHLALKLLVEKTPRGLERTASARDIAARFEHVLVDEYQDTNEVQDLIFTSISREQENLFMVGDVKQSIYAFRQATPEIFIAKRRGFFPYETGLFPAKLSLDTNFRSREEVTGAVNFLFGALMSENFGGVDYGGGESLKCGASYPPSDGAKPSLILLDASEYEGEKDPVTLEAEEIASQIRDMLTTGFVVTGADGPRKAVPGDFCVLLRAPKNRSDVYVRELLAAGVPAWSESLGGYLSAREVSSAVCMLKAVDNPLLDIELAAAMLSPFFDFTDDDIAAIRLKSRGTPFYTALCLAAGKDQKAAGFLKIFRELRVKSATLPAYRLIMLFYGLTGALSIVRAMPMGESRAANLQLLVEYAAGYHRMGYRQLGGFVGFLSRLRDGGRDLSPAGASGGDANVVRVMSVHRSKGLEFPVVFLADCAKAFNKMDLRAQYMLHSKHGFACLRRDAALMRQFSTVPMQSIRLENEHGMTSEELRVLYVALTRAREKLVISAVLRSNPQKKLSGMCVGLKNGKLPPYLVGEANSCADWILMALLHHKSAAALRELAGIADMTTVDDGCDWEILIREPNASRPDTKPSARRAQNALPDPDLQNELTRRMAYIYPYQEETAIPAKLAVSAVTRDPDAVSRRFSARPKFLTERGMTEAEKGSAAHKFMQFADYESARRDLAGEIGRMRRLRFISEAEADSLDKPKLRALFKSDLMERIFKSSAVYRELRFMAECGRELLGDMAPGLTENARIALQGVADCVFIEDGKAVIVDYKTDRVTDISQLERRYANQLALYRGILGDSLGVPVGECVLYSFALSRAVVL